MMMMMMKTVCLKAVLLRLLIILHHCALTTDSRWWSLSQQPMRVLTLMGSGALCDNTAGLTAQQRYLCRLQPDVMRSVAHAAHLAVRECQKQFRHSRWNCSSSSPRDATVFGKVVQAGTRETAVVYALTSAAVVHAITRSCSRGELKHCACDPTKDGRASGPTSNRHRHHKAARTQQRKVRVGGAGASEQIEWEWGGCSDHVTYAARFGRTFVDAREKIVRDPRAMMNLHNNGAGRRAVRRQMKLQCKCHGMSGTCSTRTCWLAIQQFRLVATSLRRRYDGATRVQVAQDANRLVVANRAHKKPTRRDLIYLEQSPDFCEYDPRTGSLGTAGRQCHKSSAGSDGCDVMCCGRGYDTTRVEKVEKCDCRFSWCCHVTCKECSRVVNQYTCKPSLGNSPLLSNSLDDSAHHSNAVQSHRHRAV